MASYEYIVDNRYTRTKDGDEYYPEQADLNELFTRDEAGNQVYAASHFGVYFYPTVGGQPAFALDAEGHERYVRNRNGEEYPATDREDRLYARQKDGRRRYAVDPGGSQFYGRTIDGEDAPIADEVADAPHRRQRYAVDGHGNAVYPRNGYGDEILLHDEFLLSYFAQSADGTEILPRRAGGEEYMPVVLNADTGESEFAYPRDASGKFYYPRDATGRPLYAVDLDTNLELYHLRDDEGRVTFGTDPSGRQQYARDPNGDEYYPDTGQVAADERGVPIYAYRSNGDVIYPSVGGDEFYLTHRGSDLFPKYVDRYARLGDGRELYPRIAIRGERYEEMVTGAYALDEHDEPYYPTDAYGNEYVDGHWGFEREGDEGYPITTDGYLIVPQLGKDGGYRFNAKGTIDASRITGMLFRPHLNAFRDFRTDVKSRTRKSRWPHVAYRFTQFRQGGSYLVYLLMAFLGLLLTVFLVFLKRR